MQATRYRMYVDESGDDVMEPGKWVNPESRYLGLTGVVMDKEIYRTRTHPEFEALKQEFFPHDPDEPVILVRNQIARRQKGFWPLKDPGMAALWEHKILWLFDSYVSGIITAVLDKDAFRQVALSEDKRPYSYCVNVLTERYGQWLGNVGGIGDVMVESRAGRADMQLKGDFQRFMEGNPNLSAVSSHQIKVKSKSANITGLQFADLLGYPSVRGILQDNARDLGNPPSNATLRFIEAIQSKYVQNGKAFLPYLA